MTFNCNELRDNIRSGWHDRDQNERIISRRVIFFFRAPGMIFRYVNHGILCPLLSGFCPELDSRHLAPTRVGPNGLLEKVKIDQS